MIFFKEQLNNTEAVTQLLVKHLNVKVTTTTIKKCLADHPDFPSIMAVSDCLTEWQVAHETFMFNKEACDTSDFNFPFIAHFNTQGGVFVLVHALTENDIIYSDEKHHKTNLSKVDFFKKWDGIILFAAADGKSAEANYKNNRLSEIFNAVKAPVLLLIIIGSILLTIGGHVVNSAYLLLLLLKFIGIGISTLLLAHSINANNPLVQNLCSLGKKNNCNAILKSDAAKITNWLSWSEVGFFYFTATFLCLLVNPQSTTLAAWFSLLALPYIFYSIGYQYQNKNWCVLCCTVQALLLLENLTALVFGVWYLSLPRLDSSNFLAFTLICFVFPILAWSLLKPLLLKEAQFGPLKQQLKKFKYNSELFNQALLNQPRYAINDDLMPIVLGNQEAETVITMVSNPFCGPCATAHQTLDEWLKTRDDLQLKIIFSTTDHDDDEKTKMVRHINALTKFNDMAIVERALNDWYAQTPKDYEGWAQKYPISFNGEMSQVIQKQKDWCEIAEIAFTPTILINGYKLPEPYMLEDIKYLIN